MHAVMTFVHTVALLHVHRCAVCACAGVVAVHAVSTVVCASMHGMRRHVTMQAALAMHDADLLRCCMRIHAQYAHAWSLCML